MSFASPESAINPAAQESPAVNGHPVNLRLKWPPEETALTPATHTDDPLEQAIQALSAPQTPTEDVGTPKEKSGQKDQSRSETLLRLAGKARIFRGTDNQSYAEVPVGNHREIHELRSSSFESWLIRSFRREHKTLPPADALNRLIRALQAEAEALPATETVWIRVAQASPQPDSPLDPLERPGAPELTTSRGEAVYCVDLGNASWECVEIRADGCRIVSSPPVSFRRPKGMRPLPRPRWDGSIELLKKYANVSPDDFPLVTAWATAAMCPVGPYPILILTGEQGSAKSTLARLLRRLIDPNAALLRALPASARDFMVEAHNTWVMAYENVSALSPSISDGLCRLATGGGLSTRALHSDCDETLFDVERPVICNGIDDFVRRQDATDRCLIVYMPPIPDTKRRLRKVLFAEFEADYPQLFGALLMAAAGGLRMLPHVELPALPRMADFAQWGEAVSLGLGSPPGTFLSRYIDNRRAACDAALEECPVARGIRELMGIVLSPWVGTATELLQVLAGYLPRNVTRSAQWPKNPRTLSCALRRIAPQLRTIGITVDFHVVDNIRTITISEASGAVPLVIPEPPGAAGLSGGKSVRREMR